MSSFAVATGRLRARLLALRPGVTCARKAQVGPRCRISVRGGTLHLGARAAIEPGATIFVSASAMVVGDQAFLGTGTVVRVFDGGSLKIGRSGRIYEDCTLEAQGGKLVIEERVHLSRGCVLSANEAVTVGCGAAFGEYTSVRDHDHALGVSATRYEFLCAPVTVGGGAWIAAKVTITKGVAIGAEAVVGANAVVTMDIPQRALALGVPARVIRRL